MDVRPSRGRKSGKPFIMFVCGQDGRHFRAFITYQPYVRQVVELAKRDASGAREQTP